MVKQSSGRVMIGKIVNLCLAFVGMSQAQAEQIHLVCAPVPAPGIETFIDHMIIYRQISIHDPEYEQEKDLRNRVLRSPLGLVLSEDDLRDEDRQVHIVAMDDRGRMLGCVLVLMHEKTARIRQMAIEERYQRQGIGTELVRQVEAAARARNIFKVTLHARITARRFYEQLGYTAAGDAFTEVTIPHIAMEKGLIPE
jgi:predicted GNAT family N-acyltransferase